MEKQERIERALADALREEIRVGLDSGAGKRAEESAPGSRRSTRPVFKPRG
jgi:hypothetical protein